MKRISSPRLARAVAVALALSFSASWGGVAHAQTAQDKNTIAQAERMMKQSRAANAYALLAPLEDRLAGNIDYDYLLGIAALDSGKPDKATVAFERVLASNPNHAGARLDMARGLFALGDLGRAKAQFESVLAQNPPAAARATVANYLQAIERAEQAQRRSLRAYVEATIGYDTNINNSTSQSVINVPALGNLAFTLSPTNVRQGSAFAAFGAGEDYFEQVNPSLGLFAGIDWRVRDNTKISTFDANNIDMRLGAAFGSAVNQFRITASAGVYKLDSALNRKANGLGAEWRYAIDPSNQLNVFSQYSRTRFATPALAVNSFNSTLSGVGGLHVIGDGRAAVFGALFFGDETDTDGRADGTKRTLGLRIGGQMRLRDDVDAYAFVSSQTGKYGRQNAAFQVSRDDETTDYAAGITWRVARDWTLRPQITHTRNVSNISLYGFTRTEASVALRRDFNF